MQNFGWKQWTEEQEFYTDIYTKDNCFIFRLKDNARVLTITNKKQLKKLPKKNPIIPSLWTELDFEELKKQYDAIEVLISKDERLYWDLYGWDCDSILIMNKDVIEEV